ncbi:MAG TPA: C25 family cysteine peptidase, partial [Candidatus Cloacimonas acidaminovorans]|nr:C25 family cysteine peptidase [Candidatus Cloacimonas acidaminovorans]
MKKVLVLGSTILICLSLAAFNTEINIDPFAWQNKKPAEELPVTINPGEPILPFTPVNILLPFGHRYLNSTVQLSTAELVAENITFAFAGPQLPISDQVFTNSFPPANTIPENRLYPSQQWQFLGTQYFRGYQIALFNVYPYRYNPVTQKLYVSSQISISINSEFSEDEACYQANFYTPGTKTLQIINSLICNPDKIPSYQLANNYRNVPVPNRIIDLSTPKQMIIITNNARIGWFSEYSAWRSAKGVSNSIYSMEDIVSAYPGVDNAEKLRNFIINAYQTWANSSQPLEYVILGGDDEIVPERGAYGQVGDTVDARMPTDIYFSNLDGNWNANQNQIWGETNDNTDLIPEVHIGRFPAETQTEFNNMFRKIQYYVDNNTYSNNYAVFMGENLNNNPLTWGGDYKDDVAQYLPAEYYLQTLYQRDGTYSADNVYNAISNGAGIMNHMGHSNEVSLIGQSNTTVESLTNTEYGFLYSQGCYPAAFDQRTSGN